MDLPFGNNLVKSIGRNYSMSSINGSGYKYNGITGGTAIKEGIGAMPHKFYPSIGSSMFARARSIHKNDNYSLQRWNASSSQYIHLKSANAIGEGTKGFNVNNNNNKTNKALAFSSRNKNDVKSALRKTRAGGTVAIPKKGIYIK